MDSTLHILLIEDNPGDAFLLKFYLEDSVLRSAKLTHAEHLSVALDLISKNEYDIIILDLHLPDSSGIETLQSVLSAKKDAVVIVLTGLQDEELGVELVKMGAQDFLVKGQFDGKVFTSSVRYAFERAKIKKQLQQYFLDFNRSEFRLDILQKLNQCGYWRVLLSNREVLVTDYFTKLLYIEKPVNSIKDLIHCFVDSEQENILEKIETSLKNKEGFSLNTRLKDGRKAQITCVVEYFEIKKEDVLAGIVKILE